MCVPDGGERRKHPRLKIRLPILCRAADGAANNLQQEYTSDIAPGGIQFVVSGQPFKVGDRLDIELAVPPGEGHFPYEGAFGVKARSCAASPGRISRTAGPWPRVLISRWRWSFEPSTSSASLRKQSPPQEKGCNFLPLILVQSCGLGPDGPPIECAQVGPAADNRHSL